MVIIHVGAELTPYVVHRDLVCQCSPYFKALFLGHFRERTTRTTTCPDVEDADFRRFLGWLYNPRRDDLASRLAPHIRLWTQRFSCATLLRLYVFADAYDIPQIRDDIVAHFFDVMAVKLSLPSYGLINAAFARLPANSPLCRLVVDVMVRYFDESCEGDEDRAEREALHEDFLLSMMMKHAERNTRIRGDALSVRYRLFIHHYLEEQIGETAKGLRSLTSADERARDKVLLREEEDDLGSAVEQLDIGD
ncbi:hypothetical protein BU26DRAFT_513266 [Trematosphaeria pertusa]|uniref:BTB domain-containing protein n=1 Tax=Trematosphaeria pertusa TaxID=390896 RepID=A0A6A6J1K6_9PLEO|nr:uncharacterized protein BU26DRAFT_513266 [Trematosphaeria pertusa]KAF2256438.1 hypothetical protein BU26DRAFT_513266 [Trematosphaeria pertusa]